jgi:head-tail adaptor
MWFGSETYQITFRRRATVADPTGGTTLGDYADAFSRSGAVREVTGREIAEGGRSEDSIDCIVRVRDDATTRTITLSDRAKLRGQDFDIVTVGLPNRSTGAIEMTFRRQLGGQ